MKIRLLGEVELWAAGRTLNVGAPRPQAVLAALAVDAGRPIAVETLIDRVWGDTPPVKARNVLYSYLSRTRRLLRQAGALTGETAVRIERRHAGYVLDIDPDLVDLHRFRRLVDENGDPRRDDGSRATALAEALDLWRGAPLAGIPGRWAARVRDSWDRRRLDAVVQWAQVELRLGHAAALIGALPDLVAEYPLVEPLEALLMRALHAAGRGAEALDRYTAVRQRLADELGTDPGPELRAVHEAILHGELPHPGPAPVTTAATVPQPVPAPADDISPNPTRPMLSRRATVLTALIMIVAIGSVLIFQQREDNGSPPASPSIGHAQTLFATARKFHQEGRVKDAQATTVDAVHLYGELLEANPDQNAQPLARDIIQALRRAGVDFSVPESQLRDWLANPDFTPYPAISQMVLLRGRRLTAPVYLDVIVWNYEHTAGVPSPRDLTDVRPEVLETAVLAASNERHGTRVTDFEQLLEP